MESGLPDPPDGEFFITCSCPDLEFRAQLAPATGGGIARGKAVAIDLTATERGELAALLRRHGAARALALRARIVLPAVDGLTNSAIAEVLGIDKHTVGKWRNRFATARLDGLHDEPPNGDFFIALVHMP